MTIKFAALLAAGLAIGPVGLIGPVGRAHADPEAPPPVHVSITGAIDANLVATSIAAELGRPVAPAAETCASPCLSVIVADDKATVVYTSGAGVTRERTVPLGADRAQWPTVITLLAGNLVRDEAAELLAQLPDSPPGAPPGAPMSTPMTTPMTSVLTLPAPELADAPSSPLMFGLVPGASTDLGDFDRSHRIAIGVVAGVHGGVRGFAIGGAADVSLGDVSGMQLGGAVATSRRVSGFQVGGAAAAAGEVTGVQVAGAVAVTDRATGVQIGGAVTAAAHAGTQIAGAINAAGDARSQIAGAINIAGGDARSQIAGAVNVATDAGAQVAGGVNVASGMVHAQFAGAVNVADHVRGVQLAPINIARRVDGVQVGVFNIGGGPDDDSFGLINIVPGGRTDLEASVDSSRFGTLLFRHGGKHWHNVYGVGGQYVSEAANMPNDDIWMFGLGMGPSFKVAGVPVDVEAMTWDVNHGSQVETVHVSLLNQLRLSVGVPVGPAWIVIGGALNVYVASDRSSPLLEERSDSPTDTMGTGVVIKLWPTAFVGVRI